MQPRHLLLRKSPFKLLIVAAALALFAPRLAQAEVLLLVEADSGKVLEAQNATVPWHPASLSKMMTAYVTLKAVKDGKITLDTLFTVSPLAASQVPSKMGFRPGTQVTVDNALKMMLVKSANDMAVVLAEGVGGSIEGFSAMMNDTAQKLGMTQTNYVNPNGLPDDAQITSARDLAILARAIIRDLPDYEYFVHIPSIRYGRRITQNFNKLIGRYPGADGFKTGFICASGYNLVASATRNGRRLIAVVLGANSGKARSLRAMQMLDRGFGGTPLTWLKPSLGTVESLVPADVPAPDLHDEVCSGKRHAPASDDDDDTVASSAKESPGGALLAGLQAPALKPSEILAAAPEPSEPILVYTGPTRTGPALIAAMAADADAQTPPKHRGKKARLASRKGETDTVGTRTDTKKSARTEVKIDVKPGKGAKPDAKPAVHHANAGGKAADKPASDPATKPAKPKAAAKPKSGAGAGTGSSDAKPAPKNG
ncbi:putative D-alanyl-D-alanine carboxypeptidase [Bradyrhizobium sp. STM 3843]|uniref:serine hydrolase n=1 Tax=Bradyrhizobium sp. STM 3843 TaxID=551947 RepID=UPI0002404947|nr:serine hydrolase [Bradyrhizobium sp. STM 3843]CCE08646.1 putative D-alanyl-D-alanine carboxypeptidase [Bradyrhizobium sp. STM 3843]